MKTLPQWLLQSLPQSTSRRSPPFYQKRLTNKQMFSKRVKHYHQWLRTAIPFKAKFGQIPSDPVRVQGPSKDQSLATCIQSLLSKNAIKRVENVKSLGFYSRLFLVSKPHQRWRPVIDLSRLNTFLHVEKFKMETPEEWVSSIDLSDAYLLIPIHPNSRKYLRFCLRSQVFQLTSLHFGLAPGLYNDCKGSEANGPLQRTQASPIPGRLADQVPVSGGSPSEHSGSGRPSPVLGVDHKKKKKCKTHSREMAQLQDLILRLKSKRVFDCKMFDVANWVACLNGENGPRGTPSHETLSVSSQGALEISSVAGQPPSLDRSHCSTLRLVAKSLKSDERYRPSSQRPQYPTLYRRLNEGWGPHLDQVLYRVCGQTGKKGYK